MFRWLFYRLLNRWGATGVVPAPGGLVCAELDVFPRVSATVASTARVSATVEVLGRVSATVASVEC